MTATNSAGTGAASGASNAITPASPQVITFANPGAQSFGTSPDLGAGVSSTSGLAVAFTSSTTGVCTITSAGVLTFVSTGTCTINANQPGDSTYLPAPQVTRSFTVNPVNQTITFTNPGAHNFGTSSTLSASSTSGLIVTFSSSTTGVCTINSGGELTFVTAGVCTIDADQAGNATTNAAMTVTRTFTVNAVVPDAPTIGSATAGNNQADVAFIAPASNGGATITGYTVTSNPGGFTGTGAGSPITVAGLTNGVSYTFTVTATNPAGTGAASGASNAITPASPQVITFANPGTQSFGTAPDLSILGGGASSTSGLTVTFTSSTTGVCTITSGGILNFVTAGTCTINVNQAGNTQYLPAPQVSRSFTVSPSVPDAPTIGTAIAGDTQASVAFTAPANTGGTTITGYTVTVSPPDVAPVNGASSPIVVTGLTNGQAYTFTVTADNSAGTGPASSASNSITPKATQTITFTNPGSQNFGTTPTFSANSDSGLTPTFTSSTTGVCTITSLGAVTFVTAGTCTINADQAGNGSYLAATQVTRSFTVNAVVPSAPTAAVAVAVAGNTSAQVSFTAPASNGGAAITGYTVTSNPGGISAAGASSPITVTGLTQGVSYSFTVTATNSAGTGPASAASTTVIPTATQVITFTNPGPQDFNSPPTLSATADSGLIPVFSSASPGVCTITSGGVLSFVTAGTCTINADQPGDSVYLPAAQVSQSFTVNASGAVPLAPSQTLSAIAGQAIDVDLTKDASGGPFSAATVISVAPTSGGSAAISAGGSGYRLRFTPTAAVAGSVAVSYTLSNTFGTSTPGVITFNVIVRSDPSKDAEVQGLINAQANSSRRFASGQISNFQQRLEALHNGNVSSFSNGFNLTSNTLRRQRGQEEPDVLKQWLQVKNANDKDRHALRIEAAEESTPALNNQPGTAPASPLAVWTAGTISVGNDSRDSSDQDQDFVTSGLSAGIDYRWSPQLTLGLGFGYGHDKTDIGDNGSRSEADSYSLAFYGSYRPLQDIYLDAVLGYQRLSFDLRRYITDSGGKTAGDRDGGQWFASLAAGYEYRQGLWLLNPYLRLDMADARLDSYAESGDSLYTLQYDEQSVKTSSSSLGLRSEYAFTSSLGELTPSLRLEYQHDFQGAGDASMRYTDLSGGLQYHTKLDALGGDRGLLGLGLGLRTTTDWALRLEYQLTASSGDQQAQSLLFNLEKPF